MPPRPMAWLACVLSLLLPGLGHVYSGRFLRAFGVLLLAAVLLLVWLALWSQGAGRPWLMWATTGLGLGVLIVLLGDAARAARQADALPERVALRCASFFLMGSLGLAGLRTATTMHWMFPARVTTDSMQPSLLVGDFFWTDCRAFRDHDPERGELVTVQVAQGPPGTFTPMDRAAERSMPVLFAKRVVGLPGDRVAMRGGTLFVNDTEVPTVHTVSAAGVFIEHLDPHDFSVLHTDEVVADFEATVEPERYFVLGDHRGSVADSRTWGTIPRADVVGRLMYVYFSWDGAAKRPRWDRIGRAVR